MVEDTNYLLLWFYFYNSLQLMALTTQLSANNQLSWPDAVMLKTWRIAQGFPTDLGHRKATWT